MEKEKFVIVYWLHGQSKVFSNPQCFETDNVIEFGNAVTTALENGYEIEYAGAM